ncbi:hypothetical protein ASF61_05065 [Duganella sp. Leaf126]|uniref:XapX domain-containing protein n=1 Tax=Duganella sp. Leaf126 TaxID=1736266 RepID=UPI0006FB5AF3|nr:XapX domain-containing protein [Duganella sp. Leaf126]KQQ40158.1 hypothetical protein ASF61_05065 [Duganella sp. Leaf126]
MRMYIISIATGLLVGVIYALLNVRSPAPPVIALLGLAGILIGEQIPPLVRTWIKPEATKVSWVADHVKPHCFGKLPTAQQSDQAKRSA